MSEPEHISNAEFLQAVFRGLEEGETPAVCAFQGSVEDRTYWTVTKPEAVKQQLETTSGNHYFCISSVEDGPVLRRRSNTLKRCFVIPVDDIGTGLGAKVTPAEVPLSPTYQIETSPGNFQYGYVLETPEADMTKAKVLMKLMALQIGADVGGSMAAKLIRLPQGYNAKQQYGVLPPRTKMHLWNPERRFTVEELMAAWGVDEEAFKREYTTQTKISTAGTLGHSFDDDVLKWLEHHGAVHTESPDPSGFLTVTCPWHATHTDGNVGAGYSPLGVGGQYGGARQFNCLHSHCQERTAKDLIDVMFQDRFSYCEQDKMIRDRLKPTVSYKVHDFKHAMLPYRFFEPKDPAKPDGPQIERFHADLWLKRLDRIDVDAETFLPDETKVGPFRHVGTGETLFNTFVPYHRLRPYTNREDKIAPILDHLRYLFGSEYDNALGYLAYSIHKPAVRLGFALMHVSPHHGTGRGWLKHLIDGLYRLPYHRAASFQNYVNTSYNEFLYRSLLVTFDEVYDRRERFTVGERLRELITEKEIEVNVKYGFKGAIPVYANFMFFSNHIDALMIPDDDRRFWCVICDAEPRSKSYYEDLYGLLDTDAVDQFFWYLKRVLATTAFNPKGRAPVTEWTEEMRLATDEESMETPIKERIKELRIMGVKAIWRSQLLSDCRAKGADLPEHSMRGSASRQLEAILREQRMRRSTHRIMRSNGKKEYVYFTGEPAQDSSDWRIWAEEAERAALPSHNLTVFKGGQA